MFKMVRLTMLVLLVCLAGIAVGSPTYDDLEIDHSVDHDHSHHHHDHSDSSESQGDDSQDDSHDHHHQHHHLDQGLDLTNGTCKEKAVRVLKYLWQRYKERFAKRFSRAEEARRIEIFRVVLERIHKHNMEADLGIHNYQMGLNEFSCATSAEMAGMRGLIPDTNRNSDDEFESTKPLSAFPESLDWSALGYVTEVRNQGQCGCCYTFAAIGALEGQYKKKTGQLVTMSEQHLVDCSSNSQYGNKGCNGGVCNYAFKYAKDARYLIKGSDYPYKGKQESCKASQHSGIPNSQVTNWLDVKRGSEESLIERIQSGPVAVAIDASPSLQNYKYGIFVGTSANLNHAVLCVGYGVDSNGKKFWLVKNSWGKTWGENGYIRIARGSSNPNANCGITLQASVPQM